MPAAVRVLGGVPEYNLAKALSGEAHLSSAQKNDLKATAQMAGRTDVVRVIDTMDGTQSLRRTRTDAGYAVKIKSFTPGTGAGFNLNNPNVVLGRFEGAGAQSGSLHVLSLGGGGVIELELGHSGTTGLVVAGNSFKVGNKLSPAEPAKVEVSADGATWYKVGIAGFQPVYANSQNKMSPRSAQAGGDRFSFAAAGVPAGTAVKFVRITDLGKNFDLDGVYVY